MKRLKKIPCPAHGCRIDFLARYQEPIAAPTPTVPAGRPLPWAIAPQESVAPSSFAPAVPSKDAVFRAITLQLSDPMQTFNLMSLKSGNYITPGCVTASADPALLMAYRCGQPFGVGAQDNDQVPRA